MIWIVNIVFLNELWERGFIKIQIDSLVHIHSNRRVRALYKNIGDDADELSFNKDEILVVKETINEEWLICSSGTRTGIVPVSYVQAIYWQNRTF